jgi:predicted esterase
VKLARRIIFGLLVLILGLLIAFLVISGGIDRMALEMSGRVSDRDGVLIYVPDGAGSAGPVPLVFALSPSADAEAMLVKWRAVADQHHWIVAASKDFKNGVDFMFLLGRINAELDAVEQNYPVDPTHVIFTGLSGGGMGSHGFAKYYPGRLDAIVINTGMMADGSQTADYPRGKIAVFLASPTDFRYHEMQRDYAFLKSIGWKVKWIEFPGGHTLAPDAVYEQAAAWLEETWGS